MTLDANACHRALSARDPRFDGVFYVGVRTTGIYCRPICPARTPGLARCEFFGHASLAEHAGYRACFRCRPELAPGRSQSDGLAGLAATAIRRIDAGALDAGRLSDLAAELEVSPRHLHRAVSRVLGVSPLELAQTRRLALGKQLLQDTALSMVRVALASGFSSVRRFNAAVRERFGCTPSQIRKSGHPARGHELTLRLDYRPPLALEPLLQFLEARALPMIERVDLARLSYERTVRLNGHDGWIRVTPDTRRDALRLEVSSGLYPVLAALRLRVRALFDLDAHPDAIDRALTTHPLLAPMVEKLPGLRVPGCFDAHELCIRTVLGQQVSVKGATTLSGRLVERLGSDIEPSPSGLKRVFPTPEALCLEPAESLRLVGLPLRRAETLGRISRAVLEGRAPGTESGARSTADDYLTSLQAIDGIGPWTAAYLCLRGLPWPDALPAGDIALKKVLGVKTPQAMEAQLNSVRPFRGYAVMHLWTTSSPVEKQRHAV